jgi:hypothetical protein
MVSILGVAGSLKADPKLISPRSLMIPREKVTVLELIMVVLPAEPLNFKEKEDWVPGTTAK